jgi:hypothetical protein
MFIYIYIYFFKKIKILNFFFFYNRCDGKRGWFPSNYVQIIPDESPQNDDYILEQNEKEVSKF